MCKGENTFNLYLKSVSYLVYSYILYQLIGVNISINASIKLERMVITKLLIFE